MDFRGILIFYLSSLVSHAWELKEPDVGETILFVTFLSSKGLQKECLLNELMNGDSSVRDRKPKEIDPIQEAWYSSISLIHSFSSDSIDVPNILYTRSLTLTIGNSSLPSQTHDRWALGWQIILVEGLFQVKWVNREMCERCDTDKGIKNSLSLSAVESDSF